MIRRWSATLLVLLTILLTGVCVVSAQDSLPLRDDDLEYAKKLSAAGFDDLASDLYERLFAKPGLTAKQKQEIGGLLVETYSRLAAKAQDSEARQRYLGLADQRLKDISAGGATLTPEMRYQKAVDVLQKKGLGIARDLKGEQNADKKKAMIAEGAKAFDECASILEALATEMIAKAEAAGRGAEDIDVKAEKEKPFRDMAVKCLHQRAWTAYYKAQLWAPEEADYKSNMAQAVQIFGKFIEDYPTQMLMLSAKYGRGLANRLLDKKDDAKKDFFEIVSMIEQVGQVPEVMPLKARCAFQWAELAAEAGQVDEALTAVDKELAENSSLEADKDLKSLGWLTKAKVLNLKAEKQKAGGKGDDALTSWKDAIGLLNQVIEKGGANSSDARDLLAKYIAASGLKDLDAESRIALAMGYITDKKYKEAVDELRRIVDNPAANVPAATSFKAQRMLAVAYRLLGQYQQAVREFESLFRLYAGKIPKEEMAKAMQERCITLGLLAKQDRKPESDKAYVESWKRLATEYPDTPEGRNAYYYYAQSLQERAGSAAAWEEAAKAYAQVPAESEFYSKSRYLEGVCWYNIYKVYSQRREANAAPAQAALKTALDTLRGLFDKLPPPKPGDDWHVDAAKTLADIYLDLGKPQEALGVVDFVKNKYPDLATGNAKLLSTLVEIYIRQGKLDEAAALLTEISGKGGEAAAMVQAYMRLGDAYQKKGEDAAKGGNLEESQKAYGRAAEMFGKALPLVDASVTQTEPDESRQAERIYKLYSWLANRAYMVKGFETCIAAIDDIEKLYKDVNREADDALWQLRIRKLRCYQQMNVWPPEALALLDQLEKQFANVAEIKILRASVLESKEKWADALATWEEMVPLLPQGKPEWWESNYHRCLCNYKLNRKDVANDLINKLRAVTPGMGGPEMKLRFDQLFQQYNK